MYTSVHGSSIPDKQKLEATQGPFTVSSFGAAGMSSQRNATQQQKGAKRWSRIGEDESLGNYAEHKKSVPKGSIPHNAIHVSFLNPHYSRDRD